MSSCWRSSSLLLVVISGFLVTTTARGDFNISGSFGPNGDLGFVTSPPLSIGFGASGQGSIYQMDGFVNIPSQAGGVSYDLANGAPTGLSFSFANSQPTANQLLLSYTFVNTSTSSLSGLQFLYFVDPDIGANYADNTASVNGTASLGGNNPSTYQVGDPSLSTIFTNLLAGSLDNQNDFPINGAGGDVSLGLGFNLGSLAVGQSATVVILLSDNGSKRGNVSITTFDDPADSGDSLTVSGYTVPEPSSLILLGIGSLGFLGYSSRGRFRRQA